MRRAHRALAGLLAWSCLALAAPAAGEDRLTVRGAYFREASTRVVQPMLMATKDLPGGWDLMGHALVDAITSASIAQGALQDELFHERRYEGGLVVGKRFGPTRVGVFGRGSREPDYLSRTIGATFSREVWGNTGTLAASAAYTHDDIDPPPPLSPRDLDVFFAGVSYAQVLTPTTLVQGGYELHYLDGFMGNPYISHPDLGREKLPTKRLRHAFALRAAQYLPRWALGFQAHYRFYLDMDVDGTPGPWGLTSHSFEARVYKELGWDLELRLSYRHHSQGAARFWCNSDPASGGRVSCYTAGLPGGTFPAFHSVDAKLGPLATHLPEVKLTWDMRALAEVPFLRHLSGGAVEVSYGYFIQSSRYGQKFDERSAPPVIGAIPGTRRFGGAHLVQTGYSLPF